jgi:pimeloyl-ACP methyl ester carboxylesterase
MWVELSRRWAELGFRSVRFDLSGIGESPVHPGINDRATRSVHALREVAESIAFISPGGAKDAVLVGLCSGAYHAMEVGFATKVKAIYMVNPAFRVDPMAEPETDDDLARREIAEVRRKWYVMLESLEFLWPLARKAPEFMWTLIDRFGVTSSKAESLIRLASRGIDTFIVADSNEASRYVRGKRSDIRRLELEGSLSLVTFESLDHTIFGPLARQRVVNSLSEHLAATLLTPASAPPAMPVAKG